MDDFERRVLRQRKDLLVQNVTVDQEFLRLLRKVNLLSVDMIEIISNEKTNELRMIKLLDFLGGCQRSNTFEEFCNSIQVHGENSWLAKELQTEVKADKGNLIIDDEVMKQSAMLVHRKFGASKRFSEIDKKDMAELIAVKIQMSKEEWGKELEAVRAELKERSDAVQSRDKRIRELKNDLANFIKEHDRQLVSKALGRKTTSDILKHSFLDDDLISILAENQAYLLERTHLALKERQLIMEERTKVEKFLGVNLENDGTLDAIVKDKMKQTKTEVDRLKQQLATKEQKIERLRTQMIQMERQLEIHDDEKKEDSEKNDVLERVEQANTPPVEMTDSPIENERSSSSAGSTGSRNHVTNGKINPRQKSTGVRSGVKKQRAGTRS